jgi:hypothetical protein
MNAYPGTRRSTAQVYALLAGAVLTVAGIIGFFYNSDFTSNVHDHGSIFGIFAVNGWHNLLHIGTGMLGLTAASSYASARTCALTLGLAYIALAVWGFVVGGGHSLLTLVPVNSADNVLHLLIGITGIAAGMATPAVADPTTRPAPA